MHAIVARDNLPGMDPGFSHVGARELLAVLMAVVIIADWAAVRYGRSR